MKILSSSLFILPLSLLTKKLIIGIFSSVLAIGSVEADLNGKPVFSSPIVLKAPSELTNPCQVSNYGLLNGYYRSASLNFPEFEKEAEPRSPGHFCRRTLPHRNLSESCRKAFLQ